MIRQAIHQVVLQVIHQAIHQVIHQVIYQVIHLAIAEIGIGRYELLNRFVHSDAAMEIDKNLLKTN